MYASFAKSQKGGVVQTAELLKLFPGEQRTFWAKLAAEQGRVQEIHLQAGQPIFVWKEGREWYLDASGYCTDSRKNARRITMEEIEQILLHICHYSLYAYEDELSQGFLTVEGGHRVGVTGQAVLEEEAKVRTIKHISGMNIRIAHQVKGAAAKVLSLVYENRRICNTLIISPPGCGKTTLLRDLVRQISDGNAFGEGKTVGVVDERSEIAGCFHGIPQNDVGIRTFVLDACPKALGMMMLLRSMAPKVIAIDELGGRKDAQALHMASSCGCSLLATIHGESMKDICRKEGMEKLMEERLFERFLILGRQAGRCVVKAVYGKEYYDTESVGSDFDFGRVCRTGDLLPGAVRTEDRAYPHSDLYPGSNDQRGPL